MMATMHLQWHQFVDKEITVVMDSALSIVTAVRATKSNFGVPDRKLDQVR